MIPEELARHVQRQFGLPRQGAGLKNFKIYKLTTKRLDRITPPERRRLNYLTLKGRGGGDGSALRQILQRQKMLHRVQLFLARNAKGTIVAWSSAARSEPPARPGDAYIHTYVMQAYRRLGLGTRLINRAINWCNNQQYKPKVISWDARSNEFFSTIASGITIIRISPDAWMQQ